MESHGEDKIQLFGLKPGWARINLHWTMTNADINYLIEAIEFIAKNGNRFLSEYKFNILNG